MAKPASSVPKYIASHPDLRDPSSSSSPIASLYSSLSSLRSRNPSAYHANVKWWSTTLHDWAWQGVQSTPSNSRLILTVEPSLADALTLNDVARPTAIPTAVAAMIKAGELVALEDYLAATKQIRKGSQPSRSSSSSSLIPTPRQVLSFVVARPFWYALRTAGLSSSDDDDIAGSAHYDEDDDWPRVSAKWVSLPNVEKAASLVLSQPMPASLLSCPLFSLASFRSHVRQALPHLTADVDFDVLLKHLARDKRVAIVQGDVVKIAADGTTQVKPITEEEQSTFAVRETQTRLAAQVQDIEARVDQRTKEIKSIIASQPSSAGASSSPRIRHLLSSRRALNDLLARRLDSLSQLESVLLRIEQAHDDVALVAAYDLAGEALRGLHKQSGGAERAEDVMTRLQQSMADQRDVEEAMRVGGAVMTEGEIDEDELKDELERMEREERDKHSTAQPTEDEESAAAAAAAQEARLRGLAAPTTPQEGAAATSEPAHAKRQLEKLNA